MVAASDEISSWVKAYTADLYAYTLSKVSDKLAAEDIVQNTFLSALESLHRFESKSAPRTWLFSILKNKIADYYRQKYKQVENFSVSDAADGLFDENGRLKPLVLLFNGVQMKSCWITRILFRHCTIV